MKTRPASDLRAGPVDYDVGMHRAPHPLNYELKRKPSGRGRRLNALDHLQMFILCVPLATSLLAFAGSGCVAPHAPSANVERPTTRQAKLLGHPETSPPMASVSRQALDEQVIETVLVDLVTGTDWEADGVRREQGRRVAFSNVCPDWTGWPPQELREAQFLKWNFLSDSDQNAAKEAGENIIDRLKNKQGVSPFHPKAPHISAWEDDPASTQPAETWRGRTHGPVAVLPPGYGDQRRLAVVMFGFLCSIHSGEAVYVLRFDGQKWNVIHRRIAYYV